MRIKRRAHSSQNMTEIEAIPFVSQYKYLGITVTESLKLKERQEALRNKLKGFKYFISQMRPSMVSVKTRLELWKTFFRSHIFYGLECFLIDDTTFNQLNQIYSVSLKRALHVPMNCSVNEVLYFT